MANANPWATDKAVHHPECTCLDGGCDRRAAKSFVGETMVDAVVAATKPRRIPADPRLLKGAAEIEATIIAVLRAHGLTVVREADTSYFDADKEKAFAKECGRNAMQTVLGALEEVAA